MTSPQPPRVWSLRRRLAGLIVAATCLMLAFAAHLIYQEADKESDELFDSSIASTAQLLLVVAGHEVIEAAASGQLGHDNPDTASPMFMNMQMWSNDGQLLYKSEQSPSARFAPVEQNGFGWITVNEQRWRTYAEWNREKTLQVQVAEPLSHRKEIGAQFAHKLMILAAILIPLFVMVVIWIVNRALEPVAKVVGDLKKRSEHDLSQLDSHNMPTEIKPLTDELNQLFQTVSTALDHEKRFTADAAHELRTPLAGIRANMQVLGKLLDGQVDGHAQDVMQDIQSGVDRGAHLINQLLMLSQLDHLQLRERSAQAEPLDMTAARVMDDYKSLAFDKQITLQAKLATLDAPADAGVMSILLRNLIDNAIRYTPEGGRVLVKLYEHDKQGVLEVLDSGCGIAPENREKVFARFFRELGTNVPGIGLGLSIVHRIADVCGLQVSITDGLDDQGVGFVVRYPLPS